MDNLKNSFINKFILFSLGGISYLLIELMWRGHSHWSMFLLGGICFVLIGMLNEHFTFEFPLILQIIFGAFMITALEFVFGCVLNLWLGLDVWDYGNLPYNILGQICLPYSFLWLVMSLVCIVADDYFRHYLFGEEKPRYRIV